MTISVLRKGLCPSALAHQSVMHKAFRSATCCVWQERLIGVYFRCVDRQFGGCTGGGRDARAVVRDGAAESCFGCQGQATGHHLAGHASSWDAVNVSISKYGWCGHTARAMFCLLGHLYL
jgi:hypothetical protein